MYVQCSSLEHSSAKIGALEVDVCDLIIPITKPFPWKLALIINSVTYSLSLFSSMGYRTQILSYPLATNSNNSTPPTTPFIHIASWQVPTFPSHSSKNLNPSAPISKPKHFHRYYHSFQTHKLAIKLSIQ